MFKLLLVVLAVLAVAAAQYFGSPYYGGAGLYRSGYYGGYASPYGYRSAVGYGGYGYYG